MAELLTAAQMRAVEQAAIASGQVTGLELMERAGRGVVEAVFEEWPELRATAHRAVVLCGPGNNGGDGFVVARLLKDWGWEVAVYLYGDAEALPPDARVNYERWLAMGEVSRADTLDAGVTMGDLYLDALFGTGLTRALDDEAEAALAGLTGVALRHCGRLVAVDLPSGLCSDSGKFLGDRGLRYAALTVTFHSPKRGHVLAEGPEACGRLVCRDIGLPANIARKILGRPYDPKTRTRADFSAIVSLEEGETSRPGFSARKSVLDKGWLSIDVCKFTHGHALIVSGDHGHAGAARLAARGALRIGAGVVTVASPPDAMAENAARLDAIMLRVLAGGEELAGILQDARINALCLGPGMGTGAREADLLAVALAAPHPTEGEGRRLVLDADALTLLSRHPDLFAALHGHCVLTPHAGEFARLFPDIAGKLAAPATKGPAYSKVDATREAAARAGCVVLYKGPDTVIADPTGRCAINAACYDRAAPWLATAGSGDVLAGFITGLLARGFSPFEAACTGAWLHVECARSFGPGLIAEDLPEELPKVFRGLGMA